MRATLSIAGLAVLSTVFYAYVSHLVPQAEVYPPEDVELRADMTTQEMIAAGKEIVGGKGTCLSCHTIGAAQAGRFPDLGSIGAVAATRKEGYSDLDYLAESLYEPGAYIVDGFTAGMPLINRPPIGLTDQEVLAVIAYLQSLGGSPSVTMQTTLKYAGSTPASIPPPSSAAAANSASSFPGEALVTKYACVTCHDFHRPTTLVGPSLHDVGKRLTEAELFESILNPDATVTPGFAPGLMPATLGGLKFYETVTAVELKQIVEYLASRRGKE